MKRLVLTCSLLTAQAALADAVLQKTFDPSLNGAWTEVDLSTLGSQGIDPRRLVVGAGGEVYVVGKAPLDGPPVGGAMFRVDRGEAEKIGASLPIDPENAAFLDGQLYVASKGSRNDKAGAVYQLVGSDWEYLGVERLPGEVRALAWHGGAVYAGTNGDGVYRVTSSGAERIGVKSVVYESGY